MISRRQLIGSGMAMSALGLGAPVTLETRPSGPIAVRVAYVVVDTRFDDALEIARRSAFTGGHIIALPRDVLGLWHDQFAPTPERAPQAFAGVTTEHAFFVLQTLAADHRQRVQFSAMHVARRRDEMLVSWVIGPAASRA